MSEFHPKPIASCEPATYFAPAERASAASVRESARQVSQHPMLEAALEAFEGWLVVLNEQRQVLAINDGFLRSLGVQDPAGLLGLRLGEVLSCEHARDHSGGCGTSRFCSTCGAAIAMLAAQRTGLLQQCECILTHEQRGQLQDRDFQVRCWPFKLEEETLLLVCLREITDEKRRMALERVFLHDISNTVASLSLAAAALPIPADAASRELHEMLAQSMSVLVEEVRVQRILAGDDRSGSRLKLQKSSTGEVLRCIEALFGRRPPFGEAKLVVEPPQEDVAFQTDLGLLTRVVSNMVVNALEANQDGGVVRAWSAVDKDHVEFNVWNHQQIPDKVAMRIFQKHFTTKPGHGRGLGTFGMKLFGESYLRGKVCFHTSEADGTTFTVRLPRG